MLKKRIIPCLDIKDGRTVKGVQFEHLKDAGCPIELARRYVAEGADELVFLDITATNDGRATLVDLVREIAAAINIPFTVGGGISSLADVKKVIRAGADKVSINSAALKRPELITEIAQEFGNQCVVLAIDAQFTNNDWYVFSHGGRIATHIKAVDWAIKGAALGAGEILLTSMNNDGARNGFALDIISEINQHVSIPLIASGGAGSMEDFAQLFQQTKVTAALAASVFHFGDIPIPQLKQYLQQQNIAIRRCN